MRLTTEDILTYNYCPILRLKGGQNKIIPPLTFFEYSIRKAILLAEKVALDKDSFVTLRRLTSAWDKIWWPAVTEKKISMKEAQKLTIQAVIKFTDYCKYDITDEDHPTIAVDIETQAQIGNDIVTAQIDIVKIFEKNQIILLDLTRKGLTHRDVTSDSSILAKTYLFSEATFDNWSYSCLDLNEKKQKLSISTATFRKSDLEIAGKMLYHTVDGIQKGINLPRLELCDQCKMC